MFAVVVAPTIRWGQTLLFVFQGFYPDSSSLFPQLPTLGHLSVDSTSHVADLLGSSQTQPTR